MYSLLLSISTLAVSALASPVALDSVLRTRETSASPNVSIKNGTLSGRYEASFSQDLFLNIPYAHPPTGSLRLANPQPYNGTFDGIRDASQWGSICPGAGISSTNNATLGQNYLLDEDCLNINIIRPSGVKKGDDLPVLFWIYGGGFVQGTANDPRYNGSYLVQRSVEDGEPIVFASINYRLSAFGFPASPSSPLNLGLKDQRLALRWMQENIAEFGADPKKVTIWGQSAGGSSVASQMAAYGGRDDGLFRASIIDSGIFAGSNASLESQAPAWSRFLNATGCDTDDQLSCLRALPYETFYNATISSKYNPTPVPDGDFMRENTLVSFANQRVVAVPFLIGATKDEATSGIGAPVRLSNDTSVRDAVTTRFATIFAGNETIDKLLELYPNDNELGCPFDTGDGVVSTGLQDKRTNAIWTDQLHAGARKAAEAMSSKVKVFSWRFNQVPQNNTIDAGAAHANELPYIFGVQNRTIRTPLGNRPGDLSLSSTMQNYWLNFVNHLDPNGKSSNEGKKKNETKWESYEGGKNMVFLNKGSRMVEDDYREDGIDWLIKMGLGKV